MAFGTLKADTLTHSTAGSLDTNYVVENTPKMVCRWDTDSSTSVTRSVNVSSLTDPGTGRTTINLTSAFDAVTYTVLLGNDDGEQVAFHRTGDGNTTSQIGVANYAQDSNTYTDADIMSAASHGDLA